MKRRFHLSLNNKEYTSLTNRCRGFETGMILNDGKDNLDVIMGGQLLDTDNFILIRSASS